jgi:hypothetical protein
MGSSSRSSLRTRVFATTGSDRAETGGLVLDEFRVEELSEVADDLGFVRWELLG